MNLIEITGKRFGRWAVVSRAHNTPQGQACWLCRCDCGTERVAKSILIRRCLLDVAGSVSRSCGCLKKELNSKRLTKHGHTSAGKTTPTYISWAGMIQRCTNPNDQRYSDYGGRGIGVCKRWLTFANFLADMGDKPRGTSIDRFPNNDGNYEPGNCRWATASQQGRNKRNNVLLALDGETKTLAQWSEDLKVHRARINSRLVRGLSAEDSLTKPNMKRGRLIAFNGQELSVKEWSERLGISISTIYWRIKHGMTAEEILSSDGQDVTR